MKQLQKSVHENYPDPHHDVYSRTTFGFWVFLLTDFVLFGTLFATFAVLQNGTYGGPSGKDLFNLSSGLLQSIILLSASLTAGLGGAFAHRKDKNKTLLLFGATFVLGALFMGMQIADMQRLMHLGHGWQKSAFLSIYYTIMGTFSVHMLFALLWVIVLGVPVFREGVSHVSLRRLICLKMFFQFLNIVWIFIYSFVYLLGVK
ncbi:MAG: cytochrome c oxidase subunit 3 [Rhabdochlamydiaceae bacterium]|nr:cytochrome c oxidase subunit 3 [Rhabdochlamydiaceae bacterium]